MTSFRDCCWVFWMVKGHLNSSDHTIRSCYEQYLLRLWHNHEECQRYDGFDECYDARCLNMHDDQEVTSQWRLFWRFCIYNSSWQDQETIQHSKAAFTRSFMRSVKLCPSKWCQEAWWQLATRMTNSPSSEMHNRDPFRSEISRASTWTMTGTYGWWPLQWL